MNILIGGAWPYANGQLHIGHIAALLPGDVIARYYRQRGDHVCYVSGTDCHGTPIAILATQENKTCEEISSFYHEQFTECFNRLGFSYDNYGYTSSTAHSNFVTCFHEKLYESDSVYEKTGEQAYCEQCNSFLADRFVTGSCPICHGGARGDQCDCCGTVLEAEKLENPVCATCGGDVTLKPATHLYIKLSDFKKELENNINTEYWKKNAIAFTTRYLEEGLPDKALTRDLSWGISVPYPGYESKKIYIWAENVLGYLSGCNDFAEFFQNDDTVHYYIHGKDNIPFHTIILPALLLAHGDGYHLPDRIISSEYMTLDGAKISTSRGHAVWISRSEE